MNVDKFSPDLNVTGYSKNLTEQKKTCCYKIGKRTETDFTPTL